MNSWQVLGIAFSSFLCPLALIAIIIYLSRHQVLGTALHITLPTEMKQAERGRELHVGVRFATSPTSSAVQYLSPEQTAGGKFPYLFTQCQAIHARSLVPCQVGDSSDNLVSNILMLSAIEWFYQNILRSL